MPDRYGERDDFEIDDDEKMREAVDPLGLDEVADEIAQRRAHLSVVPPRRMTAEDREEVRKQRIARQISDATLRVQGIPGCGLCDSDGYMPTGMVCDHVDRSETHARGRHLVREAMGWDRSPAPRKRPIEGAHSPDSGRTGRPEPSSTRESSRDAQGRSQDAGVDV